MRTRIGHGIGSFCCLIVFMATTAFAVPLLVDFQDHAPVTIGESWSELGLEMVIVPIGGVEASAVTSRYGLSLSQAVLSIDMLALTDVRRVHVEVVTTQGPATTTVVLLTDLAPITSAENADVLHPETLTVEAGGETARYVQIGGVNLRLIEVTIDHGALSEEAATWGGVKALFR